MGHLEHEGPGELVEHGVRVVVGGGGDVTEALAGDGHRTVVTAGSLSGEGLDGVWYRGAGVQGYRGGGVQYIWTYVQEVQRVRGTEIYKGSHSVIQYLGVSIFFILSRPLSRDPKTPLLFLLGVRGPPGLGGEGSGVQVLSCRGAEVHVLRYRCRLAGADVQVCRYQDEGAELQVSG